MENTIGLIAGNGRFPFLVADELRKKGSKVYTIALKEETDPSLESHVEKILWVHLGELQKMIDFLHAGKITTAIMAGQVKHARVFDVLKFDIRAIKLMGNLVNKKADTILGAITRELEGEGIKLLPSHECLKHLLEKKGLICGKKLNDAEEKDVKFGFEMAKGIAGMDIGQTVVVKDKVVLAVESIEGTDECIKRAAFLGGEGVIAVKVAKPDQDFRFDVPVIGTKTVDTLFSTKARALAIESEVTLLLDKDEIVKKAKEKGVTIISV